MKVLVVGSGGREHALAWKLAKSPEVEELYCAPGNAGIAQCATLVEIKPMEIDRLADFAVRQEVDLTVVGPEDPLVAGIADSFAERGLRVMGPRADAAAIEGSKVFAKELMRRAGVPTAEFRVFSEMEEAEDYVREAARPLVLKAEGLAAGKGVIVCRTTEEALAAVDRIMRERAFGEAGNRLLVEELLTGEEASFLALTDGETVLPLVSSQDHKPALDNDHGPNTGGMGACSPTPIIHREMEQRILEEIMVPVVRTLAAEGRPYRGLLYAGLMLDEQGPKVLEFNARFGDPETQPILLRMVSDLCPLLMATADGSLAGMTIEWDPRPAVCVVMASGGYPGSYPKGMTITGLERFADSAGTVLFHAGTALDADQVVTSGGRVLGVTALGDDMRQAVDGAYKAVSQIQFEGVHYRRDIGRKALSRLGL